MSEEKKTVQDWCISCIFDVTKDRKCYQSREGHTPTSTECLNCLFDAVKDVKVTKPYNWRSDVK